MGKIPARLLPLFLLLDSGLDWRFTGRSARDSEVVDEKIAKAAHLQILLKFALTRYVLMVDLSSLSCLLAVCDRRVNI